MKKIPFPKYGKLELGKMVYQLSTKAALCGRNEKCVYHGPFYGYDTIGPRVYGVYECPSHGKFRKRLSGKEL